MNVPMNPAESFINFMSRHTDLYLRSKGGKQDWDKLFKDLQPFFKQLLEKTREETIGACVYAMAEYEAQHPEAHWDSGVGIGAIRFGLHAERFWQYFDGEQARQERAVERAERAVVRKIVTWARRYGRSDVAALIEQEAWR